MEAIREPQVAGMFYPGSKEQLEDQLKQLFDSVSDQEKYENVYGLIAPHAGYVYSGLTAAYGYSAVSENKYNSAVIISPSHREYFPGISVFNGEAYKTPFGKAKVNEQLRDLFIENSKAIFAGKNGHGQEHALEVHLPFLQYLFGDISVVPVVMGDQSEVYVDELAEKLASLPEDTLIVASSDLSHFYSKQQADQYDSRIAERIKSFEYNDLQNDLEEQKAHACGGGGIVALMKAAEKVGKKNSKVLHRSDSGDTSGDNREVVGYLSAIIY